LLLIFIFLLPVASWIGYSYAVSRFFKFDSLKFMLSDFPVIFLFLFFKVNPHKTLYYAIWLVLIMIFFVRSMILSKFLYHLKDTRDFRKKGFAILTGVTIAVFSGIYLLALFNGSKLVIGETFLEKKEITLPLLAVFFLLSNYLLIYSEKSSQLARVAAISASAMIFTLIPKYYNPNSYFATSDKLFKPNAMYFHYNGMAKTKPMEKIIPGYKRVFFAGGSATYGFPMGIEGKAFPEQFESILSKKGARADVFNIGMMGHTASSLRYSIEKNDIFNKYPMNMLVLYLGYNDATIYPKLYGFLDKTDWESISFMNNSGLPIRIFRMIRFSPPISYLLLVKSMFTAPAVPSKDMTAKDNPVAAMKTPRVTVEEETQQIAWFSRECKKRKIKLIIVPELFNRVRSLSEAISQNPQQKAIVEAARKREIPVLDCYPDFDSLNNYYMYDLVHLNDNGNKKLAEILAVKLAPYLN
jgi:lysophospholipase L1-like esterase